MSKFNPFTTGRIPADKGAVMAELDKPGMNLILTCVGPLDLTFLAKTNLTEQKETTKQTEIGQLNDEDIDNFITENRNRIIEANCKIIIFIVE